MLCVKTNVPLFHSLMDPSCRLRYPPNLTDAREESREMSTDNAVSALGSLLEALRDSLCAQGSEVGAEGVGRGWGLWLGYMPLGSDEEEAEKVS